MKITRRGLFGFVGGAVVTAPAMAKLLEEAAKAPPLEETYKHTELTAGFTVTLQPGDIVARDEKTGGYRKAAKDDVICGVWDGSQVIYFSE